jgi:hypothetical protein
MVNPTYKHLEARLRVSGLALSQWAQLAGAALSAIVFGVYLSPLPVVPTIWLSVFVAGLPVAVSYGAMGLDFSVADFAAAAWRWRRSPRRYLAGAGTAAVGYLVLADTASSAVRPVRSRQRCDL